MNDDGGDDNGGDVDVDTSLEFTSSLHDTRMHQVARGVEFASHSNMFFDWKWQYAFLMCSQEDVAEGDRFCFNSEGN